VVHRLLRRAEESEESAMKPSKSGPQHGPVYSIRSVDGGWEVFDREEHSLADRMRSQSEAVAHAKELAHRDGSAQIVVYDVHGKIASEFFYQREERAALAYDDSTPMTAASHLARAAAAPRDPKGQGK
jgi:hypothetical protein